MTSVSVAVPLLVAVMVYAKTSPALISPLLSWSLLIGAGLDNVSCGEGTGTLSLSLTAAVCTESALAVLLITPVLTSLLVTT